jgi:Cdc6-like AAA superfamily ATPase
MLREHEIFEPGQPLYGTQARLFSGRVDTLERALQAALEPHSLTMIYGDLGIGKSSAARQLYMVLEGDGFARQRYPQFAESVRSFLPKYFLPMWFSCRGFRNMDSVLRALCFNQGDDANDSFAKIRPEFTLKTQKWMIETAIEAKLGGFGGSLKLKETKNNEGAIAKAREAYFDTVSGLDIFLHLLTKWHESDGDGEIVIFLDDFERLEDRSEFPTVFLRSIKVRFVLIGISETPTELIDHNKSLERHLIDRHIKIERLNNTEVSWIFDNASQIAARQARSAKLSFTKNFTDEVAQISGGLPMIVQYYGRKSLRVSRALSRLPREEVKIDSDVIDIIEGDFFDPTKGVEPNLINKIHDAIGQSVSRPRVMRSAAERYESWFTLDQIRRVPELVKVSGIEAHLDKIVNAGILVKSAESGRFRFVTPTCRMLCRRIPEKKQDF